MSNFKLPRLNEDDPLTPPSSDERMDTGSESYRSQGTPNSVLSSDFDDKDPENVLRLQNPEEVLRLNEPEANHNVKSAVSKIKTELNDSLITKMSTLNLDSPKLENRPKNLGISPPKFSSTLTLTTNHPLMSLGSPENGEVPKKSDKEDKDLSLSSIEDERHNDTNGYLYNPERNTSKNNLYFSENFVTADSQMLSDSRLEMPPDIVRTAEKMEKKRLIRTLDSCETPPRNINHRTDNNAVYKFIDKNKVTSQSTPKSSNVDIPEADDFHHSAVAEWCESPSHLRKIPNFELPIEMSSTVGSHNNLDSPDVISSASTAEDRSLYQALLDPYTGSVALRPRPSVSPRGAARRKIQIPVEEDRCSLDSVSACSMESEDEPPPPEGVSPPAPHDGGRTTPPRDSDDDDDTKRSKSTNTMSECSDLIPEYSLREELADERAWLRVPRAGGHATCDMKVIEPYKRVVSHGGYDARGAAVLVFSACHLPDCARPDYRYVMDSLFLYVIHTLERLVTEEYVLVYLHGSAGARRMPSFHWLHECYKLIDRRLRKSLKHLYLVHPTFWLKTFVMLTKPFVSSKFFRKLSYVRNLDELSRLVPVEPNAIPELVKQYDSDNY